jgi:glyoxylase-like metal-dependent hydrolase (beta-lactamase superfamily II)
MTAIQIGDIRISRVLEVEAPTFAIRELLPDFGDDIVAEEAPRMARWIDVESGRLVTSFQSYVVETPRRTILVDTSIGNDKTGRRRDFYNNARFPFLSNLRAAGYAPGEIDVVVLTHIHVDHVGWNTRLMDGRWVPTFPKARYVMVADEVRDAEGKAAESPARFGALWEDSIVPVLDAGQADLVPDDHRIDAEVSLAPSPGHTRHHVSIWIGADVPRAVVTGDVLHHPVQARHPDINSQACELADVARTTRRAMLDRCAAENVLALPIHFCPCRVRSDGNAYSFDPP